VVMEKGRVVEVGRHADLVSAGGPYAHLWSAWTSAR
jgi:ATP-binding cassette, subfamily C, bacterial